MISYCMNPLSFASNRQYYISHVAHLYPSFMQDEAEKILCGWWVWFDADSGVRLDSFVRAVADLSLTLLRLWVESAFICTLERHPIWRLCIYPRKDGEHQNSQQYYSISFWFWGDFICFSGSYSAYKY